MEGAKFLLAGLGLAIAVMFYWYSIQYSFHAQQDQYLYSIVSMFYLMLAASSLMIVRGILIIYQYFLREIHAVRKYTYALTAVFIGIYLYFSGIVAWRPNVNFAQSYGASHFTIYVFPSAGQFGQYPFVNILLSPAHHVGVEIIPIDIVIMALIIPLVMINIGIIHTTLRRQRKANLKSVNGAGMALTIFTSCPTCAFDAIVFGLGGIGGAAYYSTFSFYQLIFAILIMPVLFALPYVNAPALRGTCRMKRSKRKKGSLDFRISTDGNSWRKKGK